MTLDIEKARAMQEERYAKADRRMDIADAFREAADEHEREALRIRTQGDAIRDRIAMEEADRG